MPDPRSWTLTPNGGLRVEYDDGSVRWHSVRDLLAAAEPAPGGDGYLRAVETARGWASDVNVEAVAMLWRIPSEVVRHIHTTVVDHMTAEHMRHARHAEATGAG